jgi:hypothetical protein
MTIRAISAVTQRTGTTDQNGGFARWYQMTHNHAP